jgi:hypothetical protein
MDWSQVAHRKRVTGAHTEGGLGFEPGLNILILSFNLNKTLNYDLRLVT